MDKQCISRQRISKIGSYAIASSLTDRSSIACTTFNILAPIYNRVNEKDKCGRESEYKAFWLSRNHNILNLLLLERSSIICLQEFWIANEELVHHYEKRLGDAGYITFKLARTNNRGDGLLTAVHKESLRVLNVRELLFNDFGDRVAQMLHVELAGSLSHKQHSNLSQEILIVNTHLLFPHDSSLCLVRLQQVYKILKYLESYQKENKLSAMPIILCGDWNGSKRGHVYKFLRSQGFVSSYDTAHQYTDSDAQKWVSHRNHRGNVCGVDFIWLLNPNKYRKLLKYSWREAVFAMFKDLLRRKCETETAAFSFLKADNLDSRITNTCFSAALEKLKLTGHCNGLSEEETGELWARADTDGVGSVGFEEFRQRIWNSTWCEEAAERPESKPRAETTGFSVKNAVLFPCEAEKGMWPENYSLSDHARLTVVFSPIAMPCSELLF